MQYDVHQMIWWKNIQIMLVGLVHMDIFAVKVMSTGYSSVFVAYKLKWWPASTAAGVIAPLWLEPL